MEFVSEPPRATNRKYAWDAIVATLVDNPGKWAVIDPVEGWTPSIQSAQSTSRNIRQGNVKGMPKGQFEAATRGNVVYARYKGDT